MKTTRFRWGGLFSLAFVLIFLPPRDTAFCAGVVTNASQDALVNAMAGGGLVTFGFSGTIVLSNTINVVSDTILDATGQNVAISGSNAVPIFHVPLGNVTFSLTNLTIENGLAQETGGAISNAGTLQVVDCIFTNNGASGAAGSIEFQGPGEPIITNSAEPGEGGAIFNTGSLFASNSLFVNNWVHGGAGISSSNSNSGSVGPGGNANGGVIYNLSNSLIANCIFASNSATGGVPGVSSPKDAKLGVAGADANGGAIWNSSALSVIDSTFAGNACIAGEGGSGFYPAGPGGNANGGAIWNSSALSVTDSTLAGNHCTAGTGGALYSYGPEFTGSPSGPGGSANGAGVLSASGSVSLAQDTFSGDSAQGGPGGPGLNGSGGFSGNPGAEGGLGGQAAGAGACLLAGTLNVVNCTFANNAVTAGMGGGGGSGGGSPFGGGAGGNGNNGGNGVGSAICVMGGSITITNATCAGNVSIAGGFGPGGQGGSSNPPGAPGASGLPGLAQGDSLAVVHGSLTLLNSILSCADDGTNIFGGIVDGGYNLNSDATLALTNTGSLNGVNPGLGPLGKYGGPTQTVPLLAGSRAIDAANPVSFPPTDQRGRPRPYGKGPDIGAFESSPPYGIAGDIAGLSGSAPVLVAAGAASALTTNQGSYTIMGLQAGIYTVSPQSQTYWFTPVSLTITLTADYPGVDFTAYRQSLLSIPAFTNGMLSLQVSGPAGQSFRIQTSSDLINWTSIATNTFGSSDSIEVAVPTNAAAQFYRAASP